RKTINRLVILWNNYLFTELFTQSGDDLLYLHDLLGGGENERRQAFPRVLSHQTQPAAGRDGQTHRLVVGKSPQNIGQIESDLQIVREPAPIVHRLGSFGDDDRRRSSPPTRSYIRLSPQTDPTQANLP